MLPHYKEIIDLTKKGSTLEAQEKIIELREAALNLQDENIGLREKIKELEKKQDLSKKVIWEKPHYWLKDGENQDGPFCQKYYDVERKLIRMQGGNNDVWTCFQCNCTVRGPSYEPPEPIVAKIDPF